MPEFLNLLPPKDALEKMLDNLPVKPAPEKIASKHALGRVTAYPVLAPHPLPEFPRTTVDGYAVRSADTHGASESLPVYLKQVGEIPMGAAPQLSLDSGQCALIHTGGMLPEGADAAVMLEYTQQARPGEIEIMHAVAVNENVIEVGEDVRQNAEVIPAGVQLRPAEIGGLMALGITSLDVARKPRVGILSSGDEVIPPQQRPAPGQVRDVNSYTLRAAVEEAGGEAVLYGIVSDTRTAMLAATSRAQQECDIVVVTAGSSASARDLTSEILDQLGQPGVLVHGVNTRPGKPTILAVCDGTAMIGLPGNPVSALVNIRLFVVPVIRALLGETTTRPQATIPARLTVNLASRAGREDWVPVVLTPTPKGYQAEPIFGKSNLIFTLSRADGLLRIPPDATGLSAGVTVDIFFT
ncbi:MAG: gephyrin-like molybdotransferase Glp [Chloroflexota bacterium]|nr:gephyrin-like molybdotransferase Glp [Chloroflexota bacterium]